MTNTIAIVGSPTALGGHFGGMERGPTELRAAGLIDRLRSRPGLFGATIIDHGDAPNDPGWAPDPDPGMKNRDLIIAYLGRLSAHIERALDQGRASTLPGGDASGVRSDDPTGITDGRLESAASSARGTNPFAALKRHAPAARLGHALRDALRPSASWRARTA